MERTVVILAAGSGSRISVWRNRVPKPLLRLCGISLLERAIRTAGRQGLSDFVVVTGHRGDEVERAIGDGSRWGLKIRYVRNEDWQRSNGLSVLAAAPHVSGEFILMMSDHIVDPATIGRLAKTSLRGDDLCLVVDRRMATIFDIDDATKVRTSGDRIEAIAKDLPAYDAVDTGVFLCSKRLFEILRELKEEKGDASLSDGVRMLAGLKRARVEDIGHGWWQDVDTRSAYREAERKLLHAQKKPSDVFVSRNFNRPVSLFFSKYLVKTSIRPDVVSFFSIAAGMLSPLFLIQGEYWGFVLGAFFYHFSSVLDGCDGEIARLKFMDSKRGEWIDTIADTTSHVFFAIGLVVGLYVQTGNPAVLFLGVMALFGMGTLLFVMFQYLVKVAHRGSLIAFERDYTESAAGSRDLATMVTLFFKPLMRRATFAFLFFVLAVLGRSDVILLLMSFGTNIAMVLVYMTFRRQARSLATQTTPAVYS